MSDPPLRVVIAEDNYLVREGTRRLLEDGAAASMSSPPSAPPKSCSTLSAGCGPGW